MLNIKKTGAVVATVINTAIRVPVSGLAALFVVLDKNMIKLNVKLAKVIDSDWWKESLYSAQYSNVRMAEYYVEYFEDLQEELA